MLCIARSAFPGLLFTLYLCRVNKEVSYILHGVLLFLLLTIVVGIIRFVYLFDNDTTRERPIAYTEKTEANTVSNERGKKLYRANCASCHTLFTDMVGPALAGVEDRWPSKKLLYQWIRNWNKAVITGDAYAKKMKSWSPAAMNMFDFTDAEIDAILDYIKKETAKGKKVLLADKG